MDTPYNYFVRLYGSGPNQSEPNLQPVNVPALAGLFSFYFSSRLLASQPPFVLKWLIHFNAVGTIEHQNLIAKFFLSFFSKALT
jgi:hypothetical protein